MATAALEKTSSHALASSHAPTKTSDDVVVNVYESGVTFESFGLPEQLYKNVLCELKFVVPSHIQAKSIPIMLSAAHPNFIGQAKAGSGKTAAYALTILSRVNPELKSPQALCLVPVRELAIQTCDILVKLAKNMNIGVKKLIPEEQGKNAGEQVLVGTPGTVLSRVRQRSIDLSHVIVFVCDEADRMITMHQGLGDQTMQVKRHCSHKQLQVLLFSATFPEHVEKFAAAMAPNAQSIRIKKEDTTLENVKQFWVETLPNDAKDKYNKLVLLYALMEGGQSIVFTETIKSAKELTNQLRTDGYGVSVLYGKDLKPTERDAVMKDFVTGKTNVLIATNVLARGIDVPTVNIVVNYELPLLHIRSQTHSQRPILRPDCETYCHRVGRTGRFRRTGVAINFVAGDAEKQLIKQIETFFHHPIVELKFDDFQKLEHTIKTHLASK